MILKAGGNAVDAAVGACFAAAAGEPTLTSLAGGGIMLYRNGESGETEICDFFANAPGLGVQQKSPLDFFDVSLDFGSATQVFHIGRASSAVPGVIPGLCTAHDRWGRLPLSETVKPACQFLRQGVPLEPLQVYITQILTPILLRHEETRKIIEPNGRPPKVGDLFTSPAIADFLETLCSENWSEAYKKLTACMIGQFGPGQGGLMTEEDFASYKVEFRKPLAISYRGRRLYTNPPPAAGGSMIALMLKLLETEPAPAIYAADHVHGLCRAMKIADQVRAASELGPVSQELDCGGGSLNRLLNRLIEQFKQAAEKPLSAAPPLPGGPGSTTHISVADEQGNAASVTFTYGEGNGIVIGNSGILMNNLMGEEDLFPHGFHSLPPGARLSTMMSPTLLEAPDGSIAALGSGGANRIRTALTQTISRMVDFGMTPAEAVNHPRIHFEDGVLNAEPLGKPNKDGFLSELGANKVLRFDEPNLFFGGVHVAGLNAQGGFTGFGDPRRGGVCLIA